jgi:hypothetical protein
MTIESRIDFFQKVSVSLMTLAFFLAVAATPAQTTSPDVGLVTKLSGEATYWNKDEQRQPTQAQDFMKLRQGDHLKLAGPGSLQLLYFASGRQETWKGPAILIVGDLESAAAGDKKPLPQPEVLILSTKVTKRIEGLPLTLPPSSTLYSGGIQTRGVRPPGPGKTLAPPPLSAEDRGKIQEAETIYQDLRKKSPADDPTPELYFLGVLAEYKQYPEMEKLINTMQIKRPGDAALMDLKAWVRSQSASQN